MPAQHLNSTPKEAMHRANAPLVWEAVGPRKPDGQVVVRSINDVDTRVLCKQPYKKNSYYGVSFYVPECDVETLIAAHQTLGAQSLGCVTSKPNTPLPKGLQLVNDKPFSLRLNGQSHRTHIGQHYSLFVQDDMPVHQFEALYKELLKDGFIACNIGAQHTMGGAAGSSSGATGGTGGGSAGNQGAASGTGDGAAGSGGAAVGTGGGAAGSEGAATITGAGSGSSAGQRAATLTSLIDTHVAPFDERSLAAVLALESLAEQTSDPNTRLFATLFALDMRACDTEWEEVLEGCGNRAALIACALDHFVVRDPVLRDNVLDAQEDLAAVVPWYKPNGCQYQPFWVGGAEQPHSLHAEMLLVHEATLTSAKT
jgi:hypothetical protein